MESGESNRRGWRAVEAGGGRRSDKVRLSFWLPLHRLVHLAYLLQAPEIHLKHHTDLPVLFVDSSSPALVVVVPGS